ncbi:MAG TPA: transglutaminase domain-containing protein, partial [Burkholderiaceae bacterium]|nr:transglutaminase domain-containing protein [Burkholderiaceae bacterium]
MPNLNRRQLIAAGSAAFTLPTISRLAQAQERRFEPRPGNWRTFEITTRVEIPVPNGASRVWLPVPSVNDSYQKSGDNSFNTNGKAEMQADPTYGARFLYVEFPASQDKPFAELTSRFQTQDRAVDWSARAPGREATEYLRRWTQPTELMPTDGIVRTTALDATKGAATDLEKTRKLYDWIVANTYREPKVRGCGVGDIKTMLETGNLGGKCGDINGLFVGLCRAAGIPARDVYGIRLVPSAFGYKELSGNPANLKSAQHCRAEVHLAEHGWVAMDPADVGKVMRLETPEWVKTTAHPVVAPVNKAL